jgi:hypothetical protein
MRRAGGLTLAALFLILATSAAQLLDGASGSMSGGSGGGANSEPVNEDHTVAIAVASAAGVLLLLFCARPLPLPYAPFRPLSLSVVRASRRLHDRQGR